MGRNHIRARRWALALTASCVGLLASCGSKPPPAAVPAGAPAATAAAVPVARPLAVTNQAWTPEAMEALLAPIALYPDPVLSQVLIAATNPQEVLDAGNWLIDHPDLVDKALDQAAAQAGFTPSMRALMQFRQIVDQMCLKMGWTAELGQAFTNDQSGVLAAVQRLRRQAEQAGSLQDSPQMRVETQDQGGQPAIVISPPSPQVVYVPQYDPVTAYGPAPAIGTYGDGNGEYVTTGVLAFGAGLIVGNVFDHDEDNYYHHRYYYPNYGYGRYPPCPPHDYRPAYGHGHRPGHYYNRPPHYEDRLRDHDVLVVNPRRDDYWSHFDERPSDQPRAQSVPSPISAARLTRAEPDEFQYEGSAPTRRPEQMSSTPEGRPARGGDREQPVYKRAQIERPDAGDRGWQHEAHAQGARMQGGAQEPPRYSAVPERRTHGGDRQLPADRPAPWQHPTAVRPDSRESAQPPQTPSANTPSARPGFAPPPAHSGEGRPGNMGSGGRDGGGDRAARGRPGVETQQQR